MKRGPLLAEIARFLMSGGVAALVNYGTGALLRLFAPETLGGASVLAGQIAGTVVAFFLHRRFTFRVSDKPAMPQVRRFAVITLGSLLLSWVIGEAAMRAWVFAGSPWVSPREAGSLAHVAAIGINTVYNFVVMKLYALRAET